MKNSKTSRKSRRYDEAFKQNALSLLQDGRSVSSVAASLGISQTLLYNWKKTQEKPELAAQKEQDQEIKRLRKELARLETERDILKKALSIFSQKP
jgi:transposase